MTPDMDKAAWRRELGGRLAALSAAEREAASRAVRERLAGLPVLAGAACVGGFLPLTREVQVEPFLETCRARGQQVCVPAWRAEVGAYAFAMAGPACAWCRGPHGAAEPRDPVWAGRMPDAVLVPGLGFDVNGGRLGRGGGFYDRLLAAGTACRVGVAFECQVVEALPLEPHDRRMEFIITEQRVLAPGRTCRQEGAA